MKAIAAQKRGLALVILIVLQSFCAAFFLGDVIYDILEHGREAITDSHIILELLAKNIFGIVQNIFSFTSTTHSS